MNHTCFFKKYTCIDQMVSNWVSEVEHGLQVPGNTGLYSLFYLSDYTRYCLLYMYGATVFSSSRHCDKKHRSRFFLCFVCNGW